MSAPAITPILATPFAVVPTSAAPDLNVALASLFLSRATEADRDPALPRDSLCFRSREDLFDWQTEPVGHLRQEMLAGICAAVMAVNYYSDAEFDALGLQVRARFTIVRPNGCIPASSAPMSSWYAVYCVAAPAASAGRADSGVLRLYAIRDPTMFMDAANRRLREPFSGTHHLWRPVPGQMAVFPSSILHEVALNRAEADLMLVSARVRFAHPGEQVSRSW